MADRFEDRGRDRDRDWNRERNRDPGQRFEEYRREFRAEDYGQRGREYDRGRDYGREQRDWGDRGGRFGTQTADLGRDTGESWRSQERWSQTGQATGGGMGAYSGQDWRTERQALYGGGIGEGFGRGRESWERGYGERGSYQGGMSNLGGQFGYGGAAGEGAYGQGMYGQRATDFRGRGPKGYQRSDDRIRDEVCECLTLDPDVDASDIEVLVVNGEVTLTGTVEDREQKRAAEEAADRVSGVRDVNNRLRFSKGLLQRVGEALGITDRDSERNRQTGTASTTDRQNEPTTTTR
ncbi:MAG TPA: BON domain-containing protein [Bryobacteraceae bacterium]|nr:BON domain-containing protein [Bryobacteraceae bacterium]